MQTHILHLESCTLLLVWGPWWLNKGCAFHPPIPWHSLNPGWIIMSYTGGFVAHISLVNFIFACSMLFLLWLLWSSFVTGHHSNLLFRAGTDIVPRGQCWCRTPLPLWAVSWEQTDQTSGGLTSHCPSDPQVRREVEYHSLIMEETLACESFVTCGSSPPFIHFFFFSSFPTRGVRVNCRVLAGAWWDITSHLSNYSIHRWKKWTQLH